MNYIALAADSTSVDVVTEGTDFGVDTVAEGHHALVLQGDDVVVLQGTASMLRTHLRAALALLEMDTASSVSRQHYIDTGRYLTVAEAAEYEV